MKLFKFCLFSILAYLLFSMPILAQNKKPVLWSLANCISAAKANNILLKQTNLQIEIGKNNQKIISNSRYPVLNGSVNQSFQSGRSIDPFSNLYTEDRVNYQNIAINMNMPIYDGNRTKNTMAINQLAIEATKQDLKWSEDNIAVLVIGAFFQVLNTEDQLAIVLKQEEKSKFELERAKTLQNEGLLSKSNVLDFQAQLAIDEVSTQIARNDVESSKSLLLQSMNDKITKTFTLERPSFSTSKPDFNKVVNEATNSPFLETRGNINSAKIKSKIAQKTLEIEASGNKPTVSLFGYLGTNYSSAAPKERFIGDGQPSTQKIAQSSDFINYNGQKLFVNNMVEQQSGNFQTFRYFNQLGFNFNRAIGVSVRIPIYNGFSTKYRTQNATISKKIADFQTQEIEMQESNTLNIALINLNASYKKLEAINKQATIMEQAFESISVRFKEGSINTLEYIQSKTKFDKTNLDLIQAKYEYVFRKTILDFYMNRL